MLVRYAGLENIKPPKYYYHILRKGGGGDTWRIYGALSWVLSTPRLCRVEIIKFKLFIIKRGGGACSPYLYIN